MAEGPADARAELPHVVKAPGEKGYRAVEFHPHLLEVPGSRLGGGVTGLLQLIRIHPGIDTGHQHWEEIPSVLEKEIVAWESVEAGQKRMVDLGVGDRLVPVDEVIPDLHHIHDSGQEGESFRIARAAFDAQGVSLGEPVRGGEAGIGHGGSVEGTP